MNSNIFTHSTCIWLCIDVQFIQGYISQVNSSSLWRAVIKDSLLQSNPHYFQELFGPMRFRKLDSHIDCPGILIDTEVLDRRTRIHLKFLGSAARFAGACLLALESKLRSGVGQHSVSGFISAINAWNGHEWSQIGMPVLASDLDKWRVNPAALAGFDMLKLPTTSKVVLRITTRAHWMIRSAGNVVKKAPDLVSILRMIEQRSIRVETAWRLSEQTALKLNLESAYEATKSFTCVAQSWEYVRKTTAGKYPSDGSKGYLIFEGDMTNVLLYWLYAGSFWLIGQQTSLGLGSYEVHFKQLD